MDVSNTILGILRACPPPDDRWRYSYELIVDAAASRLSAYPHYVGTIHYGHKRRYEPGILPELLRVAHENAAQHQKPLDLYFGDLKDWTAGYFFYSGLFRMACGLDYTLATAGNTHQYEVANFQNICQSLEQHNPSAEI